MEIKANKEQQGVSVFYRDERKTAKGVHVGIVCDAEIEKSARIAIYGWARIKRNATADDLIQTIFNGVI